jgi:hypothetical protein
MPIRDPDERATASTTNPIQSGERRAGMTEERKGGTNSPGHDGRRGTREQAAAPTRPDPEERHQLTRERAPTDQERQSEGEAPGGSASAAGSTVDNPANRDERIRTRAYRLWEESGRPDGHAEEHWHRAAQDLDREDAELSRAGAAGEKPGIKPSERS